MPLISVLPNGLGGGKKVRSSNFELYRIICMMMIVAHHYVVLSGLTNPGSPLLQDPLSSNSIWLYLFGMWGKTGINCFLMITGYFMCTSSISLRKYLKLYLWVIFYNVILTGLFALTGYHELSLKSLLVFFPFRDIHSDSFTSAFLIWWLFIPFLNVLINNLSKKQHQQLIGLLVLVFTIYPFVPKLLNIEVNPICWFSTIYIIAPYIRRYPDSIYKSSSVSCWGLISIGMIILSMVSVVSILLLGHYIGRQLPQYYMVSDSNHPLALLVAVSTFMFFKNVNIPYNKWINILGGASFGVLLIHSNSASMWRWLWRDTVDCVGHYGLPLFQLIGFSIGTVCLIYIICTIIDYIRLKMFEKPLFRWYDKKPRFIKFHEILK